MSQERQRFSSMGPTGATTPFRPSLVDHGRLKETGPAWRATAVANRETRARIEKVKANAVKMWMGFRKDGVAGRLSEGSKGLDSSTAASSCSSAGGCGGVCDVPWSGEEAGMLQARFLKKWESKRYECPEYRQVHANEGGFLVVYCSNCSDFSFET